MLEILGYVALAVAGTFLWALIGGAIMFAFKVCQGDRYDEGSAGVAAWIGGGLALWLIVVVLVN